MRWCWGGTSGAVTSMFGRGPPFKAAPEDGLAREEKEEKILQVA